MSTWAKVMALQLNDTRHQKRPSQLANNLRKDEVETIVAAAEFFGASDTDLKQVFFDLSVPRFRVFDWLAMCVMGRVEAQNAVKVLAYSFIKVAGDVDAFIADLRETDYDVDRSWESLEL